MKTTKINSFKVIGIKVRTSNKNAQSANDIGNLWKVFISEKIQEKIPNKMDTSILSIYTNYEGDHTQPYDTILGCRVNSLKEIPNGMIGQEFHSGYYTKFVSQGDLSKNIVYNTWLDIWNQNLNRTYIADFEVYGERSQYVENAEVEIFVGVKK